MHGMVSHKVRRTHLQPVIAEPSFNEAFIFSLPCRQLEACSIRITIVTCHQESGSKPEEKDYGKIIVGSYLYARGEQSAHWQKMINLSKTAVIKTHKLDSPNIQNDINAFTHRY